MAHPLLAQDRSARTWDDDGRMLVHVSNLSKATVNEYMGSEIPDHERLGLDANKIYRLFRDPDELAKAVDTANNIPLLSTHVHATAADPQKEHVIGAVGERAAFDGTYLTNSLVIWDAAEIAAIESGEKRELSCCYRYEADMTPGVFQGLSYDGRMRTIRMSHVALVKEGRAGPDVRVSDEKPKGERMKLNSRTALMLNGALAAHVRPLLATDAKVDLTAVCEGVTAKNFVEMAPTIKTRLADATKGKLAADAKLDPALAAVDAMKDDCPAEDEDELAGDAESDEDDDDKKKAAAAAAAKAKADKEKGANDAALEAARIAAEKDKPPVITAADVTKAANDARNEAVANMNAIRQAENDVRPYIGDLKVALDSADEVYRAALKANGYGADEMPAGTPTAVLRAMVKRLPDPDAPAPMAADSARTAAVHGVAGKFDLSHISHAH